MGFQGLDFTFCLPRQHVMKVRMTLKTKVIAGILCTLAVLISIFFMQSARAVDGLKKVDGVSYHIVEASPGSVKMIWKNDAGKQLKTFPAATQYLQGKGFKVLTLTNGGIFEPGHNPSGLLIQNGKELVPVNRKEGKGNFFLKPNGIFLIGPKGAAVISTEDYPVAGLKVQQAVQSGPLLVRKGVIHPAFNKGSKSRLHRNGVGVTKEGKVIFAMSDFDSSKFPNLYEFSELFLSLGCEDALFLDGQISNLVSGEALKEASRDYGSIIAVVAEEPEE